LIRYLIIDNI
jgi:hypothetical protein